VISDILVLLKNTVNEHLTASLGWVGPVPDQGPVVFLDSETGDSLQLKLGSVTLLLVNLEEDHTLRPADPFRVTLPDGTTQRVQPAIQMNAYVLFAARFKDYEQGLRCISLILQFFQGRRVLDHVSTPALSDRIEKLTMELLTLPLSEQNHLWGVLRSSYQPSLLYKVRMVVFQDQDGLGAPEISEPVLRIHQ
jgi:Pvc16 N-terminal domain